MLTKNIQKVLSLHMAATEIKLTNVARASLEELLIDYEDFLRTNKLTRWDRNHRLSLRFDELNKTPNATYDTFKKAIEHEDAEISANVVQLHPPCHPVSPKQENTIFDV